MNADSQNSPELGKTNSPLALNRQQAEVFELLHGFSSQGKDFHEWYQGALEMINSQSSDKIAQAAHSLRELCDALPSTVAGIPKFENPISKAKELGPHFLEIKKQSYNTGWAGQTINQPLDEVLLRFEKIFCEPARAKRFGRMLTATDPQAGFLPKDWQKARDKVFEGLYGFFQNVAHHNYFPTETELKEKVSLFESLLLNYLTPCTAAQQRELLELMAAQPDEDKFARVNNLILHKTANLHFFFDKLENPDWLLFLDKKGVFGNLPGPEPTEDGRLMYRHHLPLMVLTRLAGTVPGSVTDILVKLRLPENPYVGDQILQCMAKIADPDCIKRLHPIITQLGENPIRTSWLWIQELLKTWMGLKAYPSIFAVLRAYLGSVANKTSGLNHDVSGTWLVKEIDRNFLDNLTLNFPRETTEIVFHTLSKWAEQEREQYRKSEITDDSPFSYVVEDFKSEPPEYRGTEATLAKRLFSAAEQIYRQCDVATIDGIDKLLRAHPWHLFRRLRWQLYADFPNLTLRYARAEILQRLPSLYKIDYVCGSHDYEFAQLLVAHVKQHGETFLSATEVEQFFDAVMKGPIDTDGKLLEGNNEFFYRKQLWPIAPLLRGNRLATYREFVPDDSKIKIESFKPFSSGGVSGGFVASRAPKETETFESKTNEDLWSYLNTWEPKAGYEYDSGGQLFHENIFEVAAQFADLIATQPERFDPKTKWWENIKREEVLNKLLDNASDRLAKQQNDKATLALPPSEQEWANWFGITWWILGQPWSRHAVSRYLRNALRSDYAIPDRYSAEFPELLPQLIKEVDTRLLGNKNAFGDWATSAINSVHGEAVEALLNLAARQKKAGKPIEPWIFKLIHSRLELPETSPAIFALLGMNLRFSIFLFGQELKQSPALLFPSDRPEHRSAAITAHFKYDQPWNIILETFPNFISDALCVLREMKAEPKDDNARANRRDFGLRLGTHIASYYWCGSFATDSDGEAALDGFFDAAFPGTRASFISQIAWIWEKQSAEKVEEKTINKILHIWERRFAQIEKRLKASNGTSTEFDGELAESIDWLNCECFPFEWRFRHAKSSLERLKKAPRAYQLLKAISEFGAMPDRLESMLELLRSLLKRPSDELRWSIQFKDLAPVVSLGLASDEPSTKKLAEECKELLLRMGFTDFLNLGNENGK